MRAQLRDSLADGLGEHVLPHLDQADDRTTRLGRTDGLMDLAFFSDYVSLYADMYDIHM